MGTTTRDEVRRLVAALVEIETENPPGNERPCAEYIADWFADRGVGADLIEEPDEDRPQVAVRVGDGDPTLVLNGHIDVVPAGDPTEWEYDPYGAAVVDGSLFGRGSVDTKTGVAIGMLATVRLADKIDAGDLPGSIVFHAAMGEETAEPGTKTLLERGYDGDYGVVLEPTGLRAATREKGLAWYEIRILGEPSHASRPNQGRNAVLRARPVLDALAEYDATVRERTDDLVGWAYSTVTMVDAGMKENVIPESATITVVRRFLPDEEIGDIDAEIDSLLAEVEAEHDVETSWERTRTYESAAISADSALADIFRRHSAEVGDAPDEPWGIEASTDMRNFVNDANTEAITWGPGDLAQAHTYDERVDLEAAADGLHALLGASCEILSSGLESNAARE